MASFAYIPVLVVLLGQGCTAQRELEKYNVDADGISTSGISSGGAAAIQLHVAYSDTIMGVGSIAGVPYYCARNSAITALACMDTPSSIDANYLAGRTRDFDVAGTIDPVRHLSGARVYIYNGQVDSVVDTAVGAKIRDYYQSFTSSGNIRLVTNINAEHGYPTVDNGGPCTSLNSNYINRCNYNGAYEALNHIYGGLTRPSGSTPTNGDLYQFNQREFFTISLPSASSMDTIGYVYVPTGCMDKQTECRLHVAFHGCQMGRQTIGDDFVRLSGYNEVGELNDIIILYPQAITSVLPVNPAGCWDWWGYNNPMYPTKSGNQMLAVYRMITKVAF